MSDDHDDARQAWYDELDDLLKKQHPNRFLEYCPMHDDYFEVEDEDAIREILQDIREDLREYGTTHKGYYEKPLAK